MYRFGLVGYGNWGKVLSRTLNLVGRIDFISNTKQTYKKQKKIDFCFVATPDNLHFKIVKYFLKKKIKVFCEKPLSRNLSESKQLIKLSKENKTCFFINHIELFKKKKIKIKKINNIVRKKNSDGPIKDVLWKFCYHDLYLLYDQLKNKKLKIKLISLKTKSLKFLINEGSRDYIFFYDYQSQKKIHKINSVNFVTKVNYLKIMILAFVKNNINYELNHKQAVFCIKTIILINKKIFKI
ncbi:Gfo/Idh/MocA family oxidoreductase [Candidatus Pelagibacter sp.]|jgi:hypothetical protein|nr:Gfo/Idh/MocA family oxidoreductase [Candidatus Pelagibacter sp.]